MVHFYQRLFFIKEEGVYNEQNKIARNCIILYIYIYIGILLWEKNNVCRQEILNKELAIKNSFINIGKKGRYDWKKIIPAFFVSCGR